MHCFEYHGVVLIYMRCIVIDTIVLDWCCWAVSIKDLILELWDLWLAWRKVGLILARVLTVYIASLYGSIPFVNCWTPI